VYTLNINKPDAKLSLVHERSTLVINLSKRTFIVTIRRRENPGAFVFTQKIRMCTLN
jgi:hypothetical protein